MTHTSTIFIITIWTITKTTVIITKRRL